MLLINTRIESANPTPSADKNARMGRLSTCRRTIRDKNEKNLSMPSRSKIVLLNSVGASARIASAGGNDAACFMAIHVPAVAAAAQKATAMIITSAE